MCANVLSLRVLVCVLTNSHGAQNGNDYISYKSSAIQVPPPRPHAHGPTSARRVPTVNTLARFDGCICFKITALSIDSHVVANFRMLSLSVCVCVLVNVAVWLCVSVSVAGVYVCVYYVDFGNFR